MTLDITPKQQAALDAVEMFDTQREAAKHLGIGDSTLSELLKSARRKQGTDPLIQSAANALGLSNTVNTPYFWAKSHEPDENGLTYSMMVKNPATGDDVTFEDMVRGSIEDALGDKAPEYEMRPLSGGHNLLVVDLADVHVGKLCVESETGFTYNRDIAIHRMREGVKGLLRKASGHGVGRVLFVLGNDILHIDTPKSTTTSGTYQDTDGTLDTMYTDAFAAYIACIEECSKEAEVDLVFAPSNHDWQMGWAMVQQVGAVLAKHPHVNVNEYNLSKRHRKYYRFEENLIGITHGDGAKDADLYALMVTEARKHISECQHMNWYTHHFHHKVRKSAHNLSPQRREKDLIGMTVVSSGTINYEGDNCPIEVVRSPSPPDGWHSRNGYINRQAVECFVHHPHDGQFARFTEWL